MYFCSIEIITNINADGVIAAYYLCFYCMIYYTIIVASYLLSIFHCITEFQEVMMRLVGISTNYFISIGITIIYIRGTIRKNWSNNCYS